MAHTYTGRLPQDDADFRSFARHRRLHLLAVLQKAHQDDEARRVEQLLEELDRAIAAGDTALTERHRQMVKSPCECPECAPQGAGR